MVGGDEMALEYLDITTLGGVWGNLHELNLDWIFHVMQKAVETTNKNTKTMEEFQKQLQAEFEKLKQTQDEQWAIMEEDWKAALDRLMSSVAMVIRFSINSDGKLEAWVPENWQGIEFYTDVSNANIPNFGKLQIKYEGNWVKFNG